ncbi:MAG TPA: HAD family hydrolase [archaeon]|nr:HAD family hydrolase [archaeon]
MQIEVFSTDWSGTFSDDRQPVYKANMKLLEHYGKPTMSFEAWLAASKLTASEFLQSQGVSADSSEFPPLYKKYLDEEIAKGNVPQVYPGAAEALGHLRVKGVGLVVLSSHPVENLRREIKEYGLEEFLPDGCVIGDSKDKAAGLKIIAERFATEAGGILYLGDTIFDIQAAKKAGSLSAGISHGYHSRARLEAESPDLMFDSLLDVKKCL